MARDDDEDDFEARDEEHEHASPFAAFLSHMFGEAVPGIGPKFDEKAERAAFDAARETAIRAARTLMAPKRQTKDVFSHHLRLGLLQPFADNPFVSSEDAGVLGDALNSPTGGYREPDRPGRTARPEVWGDILHDEWYDHIAEHVAYHLWLGLKGTPDEKEGMLEEIIPVLEKFGKAVLATHRRYTAPPDDNGNSPIGDAGKCAIRQLKPRVIAKAKELKIGPFAEESEGDPGP